MSNRNLVDSSVDDQLLIKTLKNVITWFYKSREFIIFLDLYPSSWISNTRALKSLNVVKPNFQICQVDLDPTMLLTMCLDAWTFLKLCQTWRISYCDWCVTALDAQHEYNAATNHHDGSITAFSDLQCLNVFRLRASLLLFLFLKQHCCSIITCDESLWRMKHM